MLTHQSETQILALSDITAILTIALPTVDLEGVGIANLPRTMPEDVGMS
jgi:hypothetical protein